MTGALAEGEIAAKSAAEYIESLSALRLIRQTHQPAQGPDVQFKVAEHAEATIKEGEIENHIAEIEKFLNSDFFGRRDRFPCEVRTDSPVSGWQWPRWSTAYALAMPAKQDCPVHH